MKFSLFYLPAFDPNVHKDQQTLYRQIIEQVKLAEELGLDKVWVAEHHFMSYGGDVPHPCLLLAALAQHTKRIKLATGGVAVPLHRTVELAEQLAMVDVLSGGRLEIGLVRAFIPREFVAYNVDMGESRERYDEGVAVIRGLFANDRFSYDGKFTKLNNVEMRPRPIQRTPRMTVGAVMTPQSFAYAGNNGLDLMLVPYVMPFEVVKQLIGLYHGSLMQGGHDPAKANVMCQMFYYGHADAAVAKETPREGLVSYLTAFRDGVVGGEFSQKDYPGYETLSAQLTEMLGAYEMIYAERSMIGHADKVHAKIRELAEGGITEIAMSICMPGITHEQSMATLEFFAKEIMPAYR
jgi:natural product biosynthesis luciferase-like monooxygenase protein